MATQLPSPATSGMSQATVSPFRTGSLRLTARLWQQLIWGTLKGQFLFLAFWVLALSIMLAFAFPGALRQITLNLDTINQGSIPSVDAAQATAQNLEDIDAKAADYLATADLNSKEPCTLPGSTEVLRLTVHDCDNRAIDAETVQANQQLYLAAHNVTYSGERTAIERIIAGFEQYSSHIAVMRYAFNQAQSKTDPKDFHLQQAYQAYRAATEELYTRISLAPLKDASGNVLLSETNLPDCSPRGQNLSGKDWALGSIEDNLACLNIINKTHLDAAYTNTTDFLTITKNLTLILGGLLFLIILLTTQRMLSITHRLINSGLSMALLITTILVITLNIFVGSLAGRHGSFGQMVEDDYDSVYAAARLQRYGTAANADESRWLVALKFKDQPQADRWQQDWTQNIGQVSALSKDAINNRTWSEEDQPLADLQSNWNHYTLIDGRLRSTAISMNDPNHLRQAEELSTGESNHAFTEFFNAVSGLSQANRAHYTHSYEQATGDLARFILLCELLFPLIGLSALWGITQRLKDF